MTVKKKFLAIASVFFVLSSFAGTEDTAGTPSNAVKTFYVSMAKSDFKTAKKHVQADELVKMIETVENLSKEVPSLKEESKKEFEPLAKAKYLSEKVTGDKAEVTYTAIQKNGKQKKETVNLRKIGGIWKMTE